MTSGGEMTTLREAAQAALEALEDVPYMSNKDDYARLEQVITALRAALAQQEQAPVAWMVYTEGGTSAYVTDNPNDLVGAHRALPLYTAPPQRKPLTDEFLRKMHHIDEFGLFCDYDEFEQIARAVEAAHGIGGEKK